MRLRLALDEELKVAEGVARLEEGVEEVEGEVEVILPEGGAVGEGRGRLRMINNHFVNTCTYPGGVKRMVAWKLFI